MQRTDPRAKPNEVPHMKYLENLDQLIMEALMRRSKMSPEGDLFRVYETPKQPARSAEPIEQTKGAHKSTDEW